MYDGCDIAIEFNEKESGYNNAKFIQNEYNTYDHLVIYNEQREQRAFYL